MHAHVHAYSPRMTIYGMCCNKTIIGRTSQAKTSYSRPTNADETGMAYPLVPTDDLDSGGQRSWL